MKTNQSNVKNLAITLSIIMAIMVMIQLVVVKTTAKKPLDIGDYSSYDLSIAQQQYIKSPTNDNLLVVLKVLCYESEVEGNAQLGTQIKEYGSEIFKRAKDNTIDLSTADDEEVMVQIIDVLKYNGAS